MTRLTATKHKDKESGYTFCGKDGQYVCVTEETDHNLIQVNMFRHGLINITVDASGNVVLVEAETSTSGCYRIELLHPYGYKTDSKPVLKAKQALDEKYNRALVKYSQQHGITGALTFDTAKDAHAWMAEQGLSTDEFAVRYVYPPDDFFEGESGRLNFARLKEKGYK